jgi:enoyl-CoA hydratase/carnithine racemase
MAPQLDHDGEVFVLDLGDGESRFDPDVAAAVTALLDEVAAAAGPRALVVVANGKIWSNGLDLEWAMAHPTEFGRQLTAVHEMFARALDLPVPTVAAVQGHAFAAGAMLALALDARVMRADRGYFCFPEIDLGMPFTPGMTALITSRLSARTAHEAMTAGRRYGGPDALAAGIVDAVADEGKVLDAALDLVRPLAGKASDVLGRIKSDLYRETLAILRDPARNALDDLGDFSVLARGRRPSPS